MNGIVLEVKDDVAKKWNASSSKLKKDVSRYVNDSLSFIVNKS